MARANDARHATEWDDLDREAFLEMQRMDDELVFDDFDTIEDLRDARAIKQTPTPLWRLIEMSNEDRDLRSEMADFADYDEFEYTADQYNGRTSH